MVDNNSLLYVGAHLKYTVIMAIQPRVDNSFSKEFTYKLTGGSSILAEGEVTGVEEVSYSSIVCICNWRLDVTQVRE